MWDIVCLETKYINYSRKWVIESEEGEKNYGRWYTLNSQYSYITVPVLKVRVKSKSLLKFMCNNDD